MVFDSKCNAPVCGYGRYVCDVDLVSRIIHDGTVSIVTVNVMGSTKKTKRWTVLLLLLLRSRGYYQVESLATSGVHPTILTRSSSVEFVLCAPIPNKDARGLQQRAASTHTLFLVQL